jgi:hypothetical protein
MQRPRRPWPVELATASVIISGAMSILLSIDAYGRLAQQGADVSLVVPSIAIGIAMLLLGILLRTGRAWLVGVNVLAIAGFLELISGTPVGLVFGALDALAVVVLISYRPWFAWKPGEAAEARRGADPDADAATPGTD